MAHSPEIDFIISNTPDWRGDLLAELRTVILSSFDSPVETVKWKMPSKPLGSATWESDGILCVADVLKAGVRLTFPKGALITDPAGLFNARMDSALVRAIDFRQGAAIDVTALQNLVRAAREANS